MNITYMANRTGTHYCCCCCYYCLLIRDLPHHFLCAFLGGDGCVVKRVLKHITSSKQLRDTVYRLGEGIRRAAAPPPLSSLRKLYLLQPAT